MEREKYMEMKKKAVRYYNDNQVPKQLENLLNTMFLENPADIYGYMSTFFGKLAKPPTICGLVCQPLVNKRGHDSVNVSVSCSIKGEEKHVLDMMSLFDNSPVKEEVTARMKSAGEKNTSKAAKKKMKDMNSLDNMSRESIPEKPKKVTSYARLCELFEQDFVPALVGCESMDQQHVDGMLKTLVEEIMVRSNVVPSSDNTIPPLVLSEEAEDAVGGGEKDDDSASVPQIVATAVTENPSTQSVGNTNDDTSKTCVEVSELYTPALFSSLLVAATSALVNEESLCATLVRTLRRNSPSRIPVPALSVLTCDPASPGKLMMVKDVLVCPKATTSVADGVALLMKFSASLAQTLQGKFGASGLVRNSEGRFTPPIDKVDQVFELLNDAASAAGANLDDCFDIIIDVDAGQLYDEEKSKYEVALAGGAKTTEALIEMYRDWLDHHPIVAIIDGVSGKDVEGTAALFSEVSPKCSIVTSDTNQDRVGNLLSQPIVNGILVQPEKTVGSLSELFAYVSSIDSNNGTILISDLWCTLQNDTAAVDLAVALGAAYLLIGPGSAYQSLSRLLHVHCETKNNLADVVENTEETACVQSSEHISSDNMNNSEVILDR